MGCINSGPEEVLQKISDCHVILIGLHCGLGSPARALSSVMTKDGKAANNPVLVMPAAAGSRQGDRLGTGGVQGSGWNTEQNHRTLATTADRSPTAPLCAPSDTLEGFTSGGRQTFAVRNKEAAAV